MRLAYLPFGGQFLCLLPLVLAACGNNEKATGPESHAEDGYFESSASAQAGPSRGAAGSASIAAGSPNANGNAPGSATDGDVAAQSPERAIAEADIIQLSGSTLYAMSRSGGLSVIDVSKPAALKILGRYRTSFTPFEMYVKDGVVFAMYSDWGYFVVDDATQQWSFKQTSSLLALDVRNPASIAKLAQFDLPGEISDSRLVGNVLYAVSYQNGSCWQCNTKPVTDVVSIDIAQPSKPVKVDELAFETDNQYGWGKRSISVTTDRIYVAGPEYGQQQPQNSTIQVVDISDPKGDLVAGTTVSVKGQITSRWQMDEADGVLRVISQPWTWWNNTVSPAVETFRVTSSQKIDKLGHLDITLPRPESLQSVRFDGPRGYAVTFERKDPLFTFDLSDPANPKQMGELEMPGFLYHMEPRGNRLIGLGYDQGNAAGAITVSILDVTDLAAPKLVQRVNFGGNWAYLSEDQDRIHKLFKLDPENGLMLVPFTGWQSTQNYCGKSLNGVQLIDWMGDTLALRGMAPSMGQARRAFMLKDTLFTIAEEEVAAFDLTDRDAPKQVSQAPLALNVSLTLPSQDKLVRLRQDWYGSDMRVEVVPRATPDALVAPVTFNLTAYLREKHGLQDCGYWYPTNEPLFAVGDTVWALINDYGQWNYDGTGVSKTRSLLVGFSPETGAVSGSLALPFQPGYWGYANTSRIVKGSTALLMQEGWDQVGNTRSLAAVDLSDPTKPRLAYSLALPTSEYYGSVGMLESGDELITSYAQTVPDKQNVVRHFALRLDVSNPLSPKLKGSYNIPGYVVDFDAANNAILTLDHQPTQQTGLTVEACYAQSYGRWYESNTGICYGYTSSLQRVLLGSGAAHVSATLHNDEFGWSTPRRAQNRLFFTNGYYGYYAAVGGGVYYGGWSWSSLDVTVVNSETLESAKIKAPGVWNSLPSGQSLILAPSAGQPLTVIDGSDALHPTLRETKDTALAYTGHMSVFDRTVYLSQGDGGVQAMTLP